MLNENCRKRPADLKDVREESISKIINILQEIDILPGSISTANAKGRSYWRLTWKENNKSKIAYLKPEDLDQLENMIQGYKDVIRAVQEIGRINRMLFLNA
jgi:hypothetical protein